MKYWAEDQEIFEAPTFDDFVETMDHLNKNRMPAEHLKIDNKQLHKVL